MPQQSFVEAARGCNKELSVTVTDECVKCRGTGADSGTSPERCPQCHGTGMETVTTGPFMMRSTCRYNLVYPAAVPFDLSTFRLNFLPDGVMGRALGSKFPAVTAGEVVKLGRGRR